MPFCVTKFNTSPVVRPAVICTVAEAIWVSSASVRVMLPSITVPTAFSV